MDVDQAVGEVVYAGPDVDSEYYYEGARVYFSLAKSEAIRIRGQDLIIIPEDAVIAVLVTE